MLVTVEVLTESRLIFFVIKSVKHNGKGLCDVTLKYALYH